ncbi:hypothetical protein SAMN04487897_10562 [Paenibacillus sp. yr247]|uniref:PilN domain-containing protein n=1 Tax=Paenibacillus sp. yr247 TaxID=1761880 RepID=UPI00087E39EB|nr:hypothetical protein [Paenibacillus sp. yr247]SDN82854.1 hypothetical protein SAMN04487897_10562 [Paenibacillus sp. yr247]
MKNINLLPKIPRARRIFLPVLMASTLLFLMLSSTFLYAGHYFKSNLQNVKAQIALTNASIQALTNQRQLDEQTLNYQALQAEIDKLKKKRIDWIPVFEVLSSKLPATGRILSAEIPKDENKEVKNGISAAATQVDLMKVNLKLEFAALSSVADYISLLQRSSLIESVSIQSAVKMEKTFVTAAVNSQYPAPPAKKYNVYEVTLEITLKNPVEKK